LVLSVFFLSACNPDVIRETILARIAAKSGAGDTGSVGGADGAGGAGEGAGGGARLQFSEKTPYDGDTAVVVNTTADVYAEADRTSVRLTQLLFDEPAQILDREDRWVKVKAGEYIEGWARARGLDGDWACVDGRRYSDRIIITDREKQIYSHIRNGIVIRDVGMGTELFVVSKSDNVYQVALPGNLTGWISENGVFQLGAGEQIKKTSAEIFTQSCAKFKGVSYLRGGLSFLGIDGAGILYIAAKINGVPLPRDFAGQFAKGETVQGGTGALQTGDVIFFSRDGQSAEISNLGVYAGDGKFIHANQHTGKVQYDNVADQYFVQRTLGVRRYF